MTIGIPQNENIARDIEQSDLPDAVKEIMLWFADCDPKPLNLSTYGDEPDLVWEISPFKTSPHENTASSINVMFKEEFIHIVLERLSVIDDEYEYGCIRSFAYADPENTPEYMLGVLQEEIRKEYEFLRSYIGE